MITSRGTHPYPNGSALVVVLMALCLVSALVLAFSLRTLLHRQISFGSSGQNRAEIIARTAINTIVSDLSNEMAAGSDAVTTNQVTLLSSTNNTTIVPYRTANTALSNLITTSEFGKRLWDGSAYHWQGPARAGAGPRYTNLTTVPSMDGHYIPVDCWKKAAFLDFTNPGIAAAFPTPSWILVTRKGALMDGNQTVPPIGDLRNGSSANGNFVIGRYAYAIYDEGGVLDINVAGNGLSAADNAQRGRLHQAQLAQIPLADATPGSAANIQAAQALIQWRSPQSGTNAHLLFAGSNNFLSVPKMPDHSEQAFVCRQDLIQYFQNNGLNTKALQYVSVFSRELNRPCFVPAPSRARVQPAAMTDSNGNAFGVGNPYTSGKDDSFNPNLAALQDSTGEPVVKQRFPLGRLAWITASGPNKNLQDTDPPYPTGDADSDIRAYFGLAWDGANYCWVYTSPEGTGTAPAALIHYLKDDAVKTRSTGPDFFELLMASINVGSLGRDAGPGNSTTSYTFKDSSNNPWPSPWTPSASTPATYGISNDNLQQSQNVYRHVLAIGANIIDQARADNYPTAFRMGTASGATTVYGEKNLPYITRTIGVCLDTVKQGAYSLVAPNPSLVYNYLSLPDSQSPYVEGWMEFEVWNPHQTSSAAIPASATPAKLRIRALPGSLTYIGQNGSAGSGAPVDLADSPPIEFSASGDYSLPTLLTKSNASAGSSSPNAYCRPKSASGDQGPYTLFGLYAGKTYMKQVSNVYLYFGLTSTATYYGQPCLNNPTIYPVAGTSQCFVLEYLGPDNNYHPYGTINNLTHHAADYGCYVSVPISSLEFSSPTYNGFYGQGETMVNVDPRSDRLGSVFVTNGNDIGGTGYDPYTRQTLGKGDYVNIAAQPSVGADKLTPPCNGIQGFTPRSPAFTYRIYSKIDGSTQPGILYGTLSDNQENNSSIGSVWYADPDGIVRPAAGAYGLSGNAAGRPMAMQSSAPNTPSLPMVLNRPFRSVGELAYTFRDVPWKNLDFFSAKSADAALLETFSIDDTTSSLSAGKQPLVAGKCNLNTQNAVVLQALIAGAIMDDSSTGTTNQIATATAAGLAASLVTVTKSALVTQGPLASKADLVTRWAPNISGYAATGDSIIKSRREAAIRALADGGTVRTWNLMIDIVAQVGRYPSNAPDADAGHFVVEGEKHLWVHVAIDRITGKVIDQFLEYVYD